MRKLPQVLRDNNWHVKVLVSTEDEHIIINDVIPPYKWLYVAGLAVDIGTTTVSAVLFDMISGKFLARGAMGNGQIRYGADVINRIIEASKEGGSKRLKDAVLRETINPLIREMCASAGISRDFIYRMCVAGNTTMNHLFAGIYSEYIRMEPYIPEFFQTERLHAGDVGVAINPDAFTVVTDDGKRIPGSGVWTLYAGFGAPDARTEELTGRKAISVQIS